MFAILIMATTDAQTALQLFGGRDHTQYVGCLNCGKYASSSIWNEYGTYGSRYATNSIWNEYSTYGSEYSSYSPFNAYASYPPVIVDADGNFYGYFTINAYHSKRAESNLTLFIYKYFKVIREDVGEWYDKIFY